MSDAWIFYPCQMGEQRAWIFYDHGIRESIDSVAPPYLLNIRIAFKEARPDGMPTNEEFPGLNAFEDELQTLVQQHESLFVGQITVGGHRHFYIYTPDAEARWAEQIAHLDRGTGMPSLGDTKETRVAMVTGRSCFRRRMTGK